MKDSRTEKLYEHLINVSEGVLEKAYAIDDAEKLRHYASRTKRAYIIRVSVIAAAVALLVCALFAIPAFLDHGADSIFGNNHEEQPLPLPWVYDENESVAINSIDSLNYYSAMLILSNTKAPKSIGTEAFEANPAANFEFVSEDIYYYELDPNEVFTITKVIFFRISVNDKNSFLASKVGMGVVDVVITENNLDNMITFKNGDRFFSCLENGWSPDRRDFSTHKYVEGFCIVKNLEQENFSFYVETNRKESVLGFEAVSDGGSIKFINSEHEVVSNTYVRASDATFTVSDLQKYFKNEDVETPPSLPEYVLSNGFYKFELYGDNSFIYKSADKDSPIYKTGNYVFNDDKIILSFTVGDTVSEVAECELLDKNNGFLYNGEKYIAVDDGGVK